MTYRTPNHTPSNDNGSSTSVDDLCITRVSHHCSLLAPPSHFVHVDQRALDLRLLLQAFSRICYLGAPMGTYSP